MNQSIVCCGMAAALLLSGCDKWHPGRDRGHRDEVFSHRVECRRVADKYEAENEKGEPTVTIVLDGVNYSPVRNSCVASIEKLQPPLGRRDLQVVDLLTGDVLFTNSCTKEPCTNEWYSEALSQRLDAFSKAAADSEASK